MLLIILYNVSAYSCFIQTYAAPRQTYPRIEFTAELTEDFKANFRGGEKDHVDAYRITVSSLVDQSKVNNQDVFQIRLFYDEDFQGDSVTVRNLNPKTGKLIETKFTKVNIDQEITIPASHLGDAVISINAEEKLHCPAFRVRAKSMPPNVWYLIQPDYFVHRSLANATPKTFTSPPDDTVNKRRSGSPVKAGASSADVNSMSQAVSKVMSQSMKSQPYVTKDGKKFRRGLDHLNEESDLHFEMHFPDDYHTTLARRSLSEEGDAYHGPLNEQEVSIKFVSHTYHSIRRRSSSSPENFEVLIEEENALYSSKHHPFMHFQKRSPGFSFGGMFKGIANAGKKAVNAVGDVGKKAVHEVAKVEKVVEKEVVKDAKVVGNEVAKAGRTVARVATDVVHTIEKGAKDLSQHVKEIVKDVAHIVSTTKDKLIDFVHTAAGKLGQFYVSSIQGGFLAVIVDAAKKAITAVIDTVTAAVHLIEGVIKTIIQAIQKLIDYIKVNRFCWKNPIFLYNLTLILP